MATIEKFTHQLLKGLETDKTSEEFYEEEWPKGSFGVRVSGSTGKKSFILRYRNSQGNLQRMTLGEFDPSKQHGLSLKEARDKAYSIIGRVSAGEDPATNTKSSSPGTVSDLVEEFLNIHGESISDRTLDSYEQRLEKDIVPKFGDRAPEDISRADISEVLDHIAIDRDATTTANRVRAVTHKLFNYAIEKGYVDTNPVSGVSRRGQETSRDRVLDDDEIKTLWNVLEDQHLVIESFYKMLLLCGQRSGETKETHWDHIDEEIWTIPPENAKNSRENRIPLSTLAQSILSDLRKETGFSDWVYLSPSPRVENQPVRWFSNTQDRLRDQCGFYFVAHDLRRTCASGLSRLGVDRMTIAKILNHKSADNEITAVYDRYEREREKKEALSEWSSYVEGVIE